MKQNKLFILALLALGLQAHSAAADEDTQEATGHDKVKFLRQRGSTTMGRQADKDAKMDAQRKRNQAKNKAKLDQAKKTTVAKPAVKKDAAQPAQKETRSLVQKAQETRNARKQNGMVVSKKAVQKPMTAKEKAAAQRKADIQKDKKAAMPAGDMPALTKKEQRTKKAIENRIAKLERQLESLEAQLDEAKKEDEKDLRNAGRFTNSDIKDLENSIETVKKEIAIEEERLALLNSEYKQQVKEQAINDAAYHQEMDKLLNAKIKPLRKERLDLQDEAHRLMIEDRNKIAQVRKDTATHRAMVAQKRTLNDKLSADDKVQKDIIDESMGLKNPQIEAIDARIKAIDAKLAQLGADLRANDVKHGKAIDKANRLGADLKTLSAQKADAQFEKEVREGKTARLWTQEDLEIKKKAEELGIEMPPAKVRSAGFEDHLGKQ